MGDRGPAAKRYESAVESAPKVARRIALKVFDKPYRHRIVAKLIDEDKRAVRRVLRVPIQKKCPGGLQSYLTNIVEVKGLFVRRLTERMDVQHLFRSQDLYLDDLSP